MRASVANEKIERFMLLRLRFLYANNKLAPRPRRLKSSVALPTHYAQRYGANDAPTPPSVRGLPHNPRGSTWASAPGLDPAKKKSGGRSPPRLARSSSKAASRKETR